MTTFNNTTRRGFLLAAGAGPLLRGQTLMRAAWSAAWIATAKAPATEYGVYRFRKSFELDTRPERFVVHASGDNRYQLFVNGQRGLGSGARRSLPLAL
jgi:alpha-L-rhamnosidase